MTSTSPVDGLAKCLPNPWPQFSLVERFAPTGAPFGALHAAQRSLLRRGLNFGAPDGELPIAISSSRSEIPRWSKLRPEDLGHLVGVLSLEDPACTYAEGAVIVALRKELG